MHANGELLTDSESQRLITSRLFPPTASIGFCTSFHYHMYGSNVGALSVVAIQQDGTEQVVSLSLYCINAAI